MIDDGVNLKKLKNNKVKMGGQIVTVPITAPNGEKISGQTYMIPLEYLYYNDENGRISSAISKYESKNGTIISGHNETYNTAIQDMIYDGDENMNKLVDDMKIKGQEIPGYVLNDGRVVDGNRRFTAKRIMSNDSDVHGVQYFEAVILDGLSVADSNDRALIKQLELRIQFGRQEKEDYDPIDKAIAAYKAIKVNKNMSISDYALYTDSKQNDIIKLVNEAELIVEFLRFINADENDYFIAKDMKLDGPLQDMLPQYKGTIKESDNKSEILSSLFAKIIQLRSNDGEADFKGDFRNIVKKVIGKEKENDYLEDVEDDTDTIEIALSKNISGNEEKVSSVDDLYNRINSDAAAISALSDVAVKSNDVLNEMDNEKKKDEPNKLITEAINKLDAVNVDVLKYISEKDKKHIINNIRTIQMSINYIKERLSK